MDKDLQDKGSVDLFHDQWCHQYGSEEVLYDDVKVEAYHVLLMLQHLPIHIRL